jgi:Spy/CpxP family protein refolding chaperone
MDVKKRIAAVGIALTLSLPAVVVAQQAQSDRAERGAWAGKAHHGFGRHLLGRAAAELNLTEQQKQFARRLLADTRKQAEPISTQLRQNRQELAEAVKANNLSGIDQISQRQGTLMAQLSALHAKAMASFYAQLTPEQKAKADEFHARVRERAGHRMKHRTAQ